MELKEPLEKLFNTLGKQMAKDYYGLDLNFKVVGKLEDSPDYSPDLMILVQTDKVIPNTLMVQNTGWGNEKYATLENLQWNLSVLLKYITNKGVGIILNQSQLRTNDLPYPDEDDYIDHPERFTPLVDETYVLENNTGWVYYLGIDKKIDQHTAFHLSEIESEDWWESLTNEDKKKLEKLY